MKPPSTRCRSSTRRSRRIRSRNCTPRVLRRRRVRRPRHPTYSDAAGAKRAADLSTFTKPGLTLLRANQRATRYDWDLNADRIARRAMSGRLARLGCQPGPDPGCHGRVAGRKASSLFSSPRARARRHEGEQEKLGQSAFCGGDGLATDVELSPQACRTSVVVGSSKRRSACNASPPRKTFHAASRSSPTN